MNEQADQAVQIAKEFLTSQGFRHGSCIGVNPLSQTAWEVEFAYEGLNSRSDTTDPPSILLRVDLSTQNVDSIELM
jgi:hypothetical protein